MLKRCVTMDEVFKPIWIPQPDGRWWIKIDDDLPVRLIEPAQFFDFPQPRTGRSENSLPSKLN